MEVLGKVLTAGAVFVLLVLLIRYIYPKAEKNYWKSLRYEAVKDVASVRKKESEGFVVSLSYKGDIHGFEDKELYDGVETGDEVRVIVHQGYDKKGEPVHRYLSIDQ